MGKHARYWEGAACPYYNDQEHLRTVLLDTKNRLQGISTVYVGSLNAALIRVGEVFKPALKRNSAALIVVHNHPSGAPRSA
ncbi:MAG TPA: JAB domain-containing protein [Edaphobacter sp.]|nr:JAB domain-containing protein [Edaphobacter sp.]